MTALRSWRNDEHEGYVKVGDTFVATELRARELEANGLAERVTEDPADPPAQHEEEAAPPAAPARHSGKRSR